MTQPKPVTPVRISRAGRHHTAAENDVPVTASMELLPPEAASSPLTYQSYNSGERHSQGGAAIGPSSVLTQASIRKASSVQYPHGDTVISLSSTKPADAQHLGQLLMQLSNSQSLSANGSQTASGMTVQLHPQRDGLHRNPSHRYQPFTGSNTGANEATLRDSRGSSASSMLVGGVPGPLPTITPGVLSRLWTPDSCLTGFDDSANARASMSSAGLASIHAGGGGGGTPSKSQHRMYRQGSDVAADAEHSEFLRYLDSRHTTEDGASDQHAFVMPNYSSLNQSRASFSRQSFQHSGHMDLDAAAGARGGGGVDCESQPPGSPHSVASGVMRGSGVFFTALRRSFTGPGRQGLEEEASCMSSRSAAPTEVMSCVSRTNPMQEPSVLTDVEGVGGAASSLHDQGPAAQQGMAGSSHSGDLGDEDAEMNDYLTAYDEDGTKSVWSNPVQTPPGTAPPTAEPSRASFLSLLCELYQDAGQAAVDSVVQAQPSEPAPSELSCVTSEPSEVEPDDQEPQESPDQDNSRMSMHEVEAAQAARKSELSTFMTELESKVGEDGEALVQLPADYQVLVQQLLLARRQEYDSLAGWLGPRRFEDLPINNMPDSHDDPKVNEGLSRIRALDAKLSQQAAKVMIMARERDPDGWAAAERQRLQRQAAAVEQALRKERMRRMRTAQLARLLTSSEAGQSGSQVDDLRASSAVSVTSHRGVSRALGLKPEEELLVEAILERDEQQEGSNPFELSGQACLPADEPELHPTPLPSRPSSAVLTSVSADGRLVLAPLALSSVPLQGEASAAELLRVANQVASGIAAQASSDGQDEAARRQGSGDGSYAGVDLAMGLAVHTRALLRAQQAAVAGMPLAAINAHLEQFALEHSWLVDGSLSIVTSSKIKAGCTPAASEDAGSQVRTHISKQKDKQEGRSQAVQTPNQGPAAPPSAAGEGPQVKAAPGALNPPLPSTVHSELSKKDYLREEREAKELAIREAELDARIRAFKTSDPASLGVLTPEQLSVLVQECRILSERASARQTATPAGPLSARSTQGDDVLAGQQPGAAVVSGSPSLASRADQDKQDQQQGVKRRISAGSRPSSSKTVSSVASRTQLSGQKLATTGVVSSDGSRGVGAKPKVSSRPTSGARDQLL